MDCLNENLINALAFDMQITAFQDLPTVSTDDIEAALQDDGSRMQQNRGGFLCGVCGKSYSTKVSLSSHRRVHKDSFSCQICHYQTNRRDNWNRHLKSKRHVERSGHANQQPGTSVARGDDAEHQSSPNKKARRQPAEHSSDLTPANYEGMGASSSGTQRRSAPIVHNVEGEAASSSGIQRRSLQSARPNVEGEVASSSGVQRRNLQRGHSNVEGEAASSSGVQRHERNGLNDNANVRGEVANSAGTRRRRSALNDNVEVIEMNPETEDERYDLVAFMREKRGLLKSKIEERRQRQNIKFYLTVQVRMIKYSVDGTYEEQRPYFRSRVHTVLPSTNEDELEHSLNESFQKVFKAMEDFIKNGSGYQMEEVIVLQLTITRYNPLRAGWYIELPETLTRSQSLVNVMNRDERCFMWSVLASLHPAVENPELVHHYQPFENTLNMDGIDVPTPITQMGKFERQNPGLSINVFGYEEDKNSIYPLYISKLTSIDLHHINLLYMKIADGRTHYILIKNLNRFLSRTKKHKTEMFFCRRCLQGFTEAAILQNHETVCNMFQAQRITLPKEGEVLEFKEYAKTHKHPFVIYADFECLTRKIQGCEGAPDRSNSSKYQVMEPFSFAYQRISIDERYDKEMVLYRGPDAVEKFLEYLLQEEKEIMTIMNRNTPMIVNDFARMEFAKATTCYACRKPFSEKNAKVMDHDHLTGDVRGIACNNCNLKMKVPKYIPVLLHNLRGFDANLIMSKIGKHKDREIKIIPNNQEKYLSFSLGHLRFIDSLLFLDESLAKLTSNLAEEGDAHFNQLAKCFPNPEQFTMMMRKGVFPYDYVDDESKLLETSLPSKQDFDSKLTGEGITEEDYQFAQRVWKSMKIKNLGEYSDVYLKMDVALLADIFERFRDICMKDYQLDPCHFYTLPGLSWCAMLKKTGKVLDLIWDVDMLLFIEKGLRGGVSSIFHRYASANNPHFDDYDPGKPTTYLGYFDANNLYGWSMSQPLPYGQFSWVDERRVNALTDNLKRIPSDSSYGYIFEVDLEYPEELHDWHNDFPLAPERKTVTTDDLSPFSRTLLEEVIGQKTLGKTEKLIPNLYDKERYVLHYRNLQLYVELGMRIKRVHRVLQFKQDPWLKEYIDFNTEKRKNARTKFEKSLYKLLNNSIFGRSLMNTRKHVDVKLCHTETKFLKYSARPSYKSCSVFNEDLVAVENTRTEVLMNQPIYMGFTILDLSKLLMFQFHYKHMKQLYGDRIRVCFSDTDSFMYEIQTECMYQDMVDHHHLFDTSEYPETHFVYSEENKKTLGKFKDETNAVAIKEFIGLRAKMYSYSYTGGEKHTAKGVTKSASNHLKHNMYKDCLLENNIYMCQMNTIRAEKHSIYAETMRKKSLVPFDDKRWVCADGISTRAYGHKDNN